MSYRVETTWNAESEAYEVYHHIAERSPQNAARWFHELRKAILCLEEFPERCALAPESEVFDEPIRQLIFGNYRCLFLMRGESVFVLHVRHGARRPLRRDEIQSP